MSKTVSAAITPFENMGKKIGELGMSLPKYAPIPGTGGLSMKSMERVPISISDSISKNESANFEKSSLGKMLHADLNIPPDQIKKMTDAIHTGKKEAFKEAWKNNQPFIDRQNSHNSGIVEEFIKKVKEDDSYLEHLGVDPIQRAKFNELKQKDLNSESTRKEILNLMRGTFGSGTNA